MDRVLKNVFAIMLYAVFGFLLVVVVASAGARGQNVSVSSGSQLRVVDGDTIHIGRRKFRLMGFDTPEIHFARCPEERRLGIKAKEILGRLLATGRGNLILSGKSDRYRRELATLEINGTDVAIIFIRRGLAYAYHGRKRRNWCSPIDRKKINAETRIERSRTKAGS